VVYLFIALGVLLEEKLKSCSKLYVHSEKLLLLVLEMPQRKHLSTIVTDSLMLEFLLDETLPGYAKLESYLLEHHMSISPEGMIYVKFTTDWQKNRYCNELGAKFC